MLTNDTAALYLLEHSLIDARSITEGDLLVLDSSRRNSNFEIISERGPSYLVKQGFGSRRAAGIANEAAIYALVHTQAGSSRSSLNPFLPVLRHYDSKRHLLVTELVPEAIPLGEYHLRTGRFSTRLAAQIGKALSILHSLEMTPNPQSAIRNPQSLGPPWVLSAHHTTVDLYRQLSNANLQLVGALQRIPGLGDRLDALRNSWRHTSLIHYDLKLENIIVTGGRPAHVKLIDWELAGMGDPSWDVGSIMGEYLAAWLLSIPVTGHHPPDRFLELARYPLSKIQPAIRSLWQAYTRPKAEGRSRATAHQAPVTYAASYAAARLIQTAFERSQTASVLTGEALILIQVAANILERPPEAAIHLMGIPPVVSWHVPTARNAKRET